MSKSIVYITNENPFYIKMLMNSLRMLINHLTSAIIVRVFLIKDNSSLTIKRGGFNNSGNTVNDLKQMCASWNIELIEKEPLAISGEEDYFHINRKYIGECPENSVLYIDADTFIFDDLKNIFELYWDDFTAARAEWTIGRQFPSDVFPRIETPFSSGVMLFNNKSHVPWAENLDKYCKAFREREHPLSDWLYAQHEECLLREEFSATAWVNDNKISFDYFEEVDVQLIKHNEDFDKLGKQKIFHCYTPNWRTCRNRLNVNKKKRKMLWMR